MTKVTWDDPGTRLFHTGIDRGMLYTGTDIPLAVPWPGLVSVTESPEGGDTQAFFLDGRKILDIANGEDFSGTIEAFAAPIEFAPCAGRNHLSTGLFASEQSKQTFGFSYRTLVGNDISDIGFAYKVHVVYNAIAQISNFSHGTITDNSNPVTHSWGITTFPVVVGQGRPTAHVIFDTRFNDTDTIVALEDILYGNDSDDPRLPSVTDLTTLLAS